ncbi:leucine-rich PPR motif-containing protein, mitochondrial-like [Phymastichus coffea]|uniref:leucine-rich PPR motif-containing protein, mitochondrial-like n=1 Tax=Phymastichus coffea TaxID=108790 RepID=UPI00273B01BA|nr:leucine-rich PPR motif-containing protein, mitochondrial-like [Phymastichus coffea]
MMIFIRLLKVFRCLNISPKTRSTSRNTLKYVAFPRLLHSQALFFTNQKNELITVIQAQRKEEVSKNHKLINLFQHEIQNYGRLRKIDVDKLLENVKELGAVSNLQGLFLLKCCSELISNKSTLSRRLLADEIWKTLKGLDVQLDVSHYNALLNVYAETNHLYSPIDFLEEMVKAGIKPNRVTYQKLVAQYCNEGQVIEASQILNHVKSEGIHVNEDMLSSLIYGNFVNNNDEVAFEYLKDMEKNGVQLTVKTYSILLYIYANRGEIDNIRKTLKECEAKDVWVPDKALLRIIHNLSIHGFPQYIDEILALTRRGNVYLSEATKIIYKLIEEHHYEPAFKIYQTLPENRKITGGNIFLQALINSDAPLERSVEYCRLMEIKKLNHKAFLLAVQKNANDVYHSSIKLLKAWKQLGGVIRADYFFPILKAYGEAGQNKEIMNVLQKMTSEFELQPSVYMLINSVLPYMQCDDDEILFVLFGYQVNHVHAANSVLIYLLKKNEIRKAVKFMSNFSMQYRAEIVKSNLLNAFINTEDVPSFVSILHHLYMHKFNYENHIAEDNINKVVYSQKFIDSFISETVDTILSKNESAPSTINKYLIISLFRNLIDKGIHLSPAVTDDIRIKLSNEMTPQIEKALTNLKSENLVPKPILRQLQNMCLKTKLTNIGKLEKLAKVSSVSNKINSLKYQKQLLYYYCSILNYDKMYQVLQELEINCIQHFPSTYATAIDAFLRMNKIDEAEAWLLRARGMIPDFHVSKIILLKLATAIAEQGHFKRALDCLNQPTVSSNIRSLRTCTKFLTAVMQFDDENYLLQAFDVLNENGYITVLKSHLFIPLVLLYLHRGNNEVALEKFKWVYKVYDLAPCQIQLMKTFIKTEDKNSLNQVITVSEEVDGSLTCYFNLALAYLENSQLSEAKNVIEKHIPHLLETIVFEQAVFYCNNGQIDYLENLLEILNNLNYDVEKLCVVLLKAFGYYNEWERGYKLWMKMKDNIKFSNTFFDYFNLVMNTKDNGNSMLQEFLEATEGSDEMKNRELLDKLPILYKSDGYSRLCKKACQKENFSETIELCKELKNQFNLDIHSFDAEFILDVMVKNKDVDSVEKIGIYMSRNLKNQIKYNFYLNRVYLMSGSWNLYLKDIEKRLDEGTVNWLNLNMHVRTTVECLFQHPELLEQYELVAHRCNENNIPGPIHVLWIYYFFTNESKSEKLWSQFIKKSKISIWMEVKNFQQTTPEIYVKVAELLKDSEIKKSTMSNNFTSLIERALKSDHPNKYVIGLQCLLHATEKLPMESYDIDLLVRLQKGLENSGVKWPWSSRSNKEEEKQQVKNTVKAITALYK